MLGGMRQVRAVDGFRLSYNRSGHFIPLERPAEFAAAITAFT
jgi:pimeloyl-ACP methyl ester carboxylesterase